MALAISLVERIRNRRARSRGARKAAGTRPDRSERARYALRLRALVKVLRENTSAELFGLLKRLEPEYTRQSVTSDSVKLKDGYANEVNRAIRGMSSRARDVGALAESIATEWSNGVNGKQRRQFYQAIENSIGVNLNGIVQEPGVADILDATIAENVNLIQSLPDEYYKKITTVVNNSINRKNSSSSIIKELKKIGIETDTRAKLIARDQTQKLNAAITQGRQEAMGIVEYEWQASGDERMRPTHRRNNGKTFRWDTPPKDTGHPGEDIQCRCIALPIIDLDNI